MRSNFLIASLFIVCLVSCDRSDCGPGGDPNGCSCYEIYAPVCGCDGVTYGNDCQAECAGVSEYTAGACD